MKPGDRVVVRGSGGWRGKTLYADRSCLVVRAIGDLIEVECRDGWPCYIPGQLVPETRWLRELDLEVTP